MYWALQVWIRWGVGAARALRGHRQKEDQRMHLSARQTPCLRGTDPLVWEGSLARRHLLPMAEEGSLPWHQMLADSDWTHWGLASVDLSGI